MRLPTSRTAALLGFLFALVFPGVARSVELGIDAGVGVQIYQDFNQTIIGVGVPLNENTTSLGVQSVHLGLPVSRSGQMETSLGFALTSYDVGNRRVSFGHFLASLSYLQPFSSSAPRRSPFVRGGVLGSVSAASDLTPRNQFGLGAGVGYRWPMGQVFGGRIEGYGARWIGNDDAFGHWDLTFRVGLSAFSG
jgi:hypothetical protein